MMLLDRLVAAFAAMASTLYFMAAAMAWYRVLRPKKTLSLPYVRSIILDRAFAWSALAVIFYTVMAIKLEWYHWSDDGVDVVRMLAFATIFVCGLVSIRAITIKHFGYSVVGWFGLISLVVGVVVLFL